jgi:hypothetical protein
MHKIILGSIFRPDAAHNGRGPSHNSLLIKQIEQIARRLRVVQPARHFEK